MIEGEQKIDMNDIIKYSFMRTSKEKKNFIYYEERGECMNSGRGRK
jgi:hypothetical protein